MMLSSIDGFRYYAIMPLITTCHYAAGYFTPLTIFMPPIF
jgi:hypothetical protein